MKRIGSFELIVNNNHEREWVFFRKINNLGQNQDLQ